MPNIYKLIGTPPSQASFLSDRKGPVPASRTKPKPNSGVHTLPILPQTAPDTAEASPKTSAAHRSFNERVQKANATGATEGKLGDGSAAAARVAAKATTKQPDPQDATETIPREPTPKLGLAKRLGFREGSRGFLSVRPRRSGVDGGRIPIGF